MCLCVCVCVYIVEWFLKDHVTLKPGKMTDEIQLYITGITYILKYIKHKSYFKW